MAAGRPIRSHRCQPDLRAVLQELYGAFAEDLSFTHCLDAISRPLRSHIAAVHHEDYDAGHASLEIVGEISRDEIEALSEQYATRWSGKNPWMNHGLEVLLRRGFTDGDAVVPERELLVEPYFQHFLRRMDVRLWEPVSTAGPPVSTKPGSGVGLSDLSASACHLQPMVSMCRVVVVSESPSHRTTVGRQVRLRVWFAFALKECDQAAGWTLKTNRGFQTSEKFP